MTGNGIDYRTVESPGGLPAVADLIGSVFGSDYGPPMPTDLLAAVAYAGGFIGGAFDGARLVGTVVAFGEVADDRHPAAALHSHVAAVDPAVRGRRVGQGLKWFQRQWALRRGISVIHWTFDPLVRRNAVINLNRLGATASVYEENFYGAIDDALNAGQDTDRLVISWDLESDRTLAALREWDAAAPAAQAVAAPAIKTPFVDAPFIEAPCIETPPDIEALVAEDPAVAQGWRSRQRAAFRALPDGWRVVGIDAAGRYTIETRDRAAADGRTVRDSA